jgi:hypothetical protein
MRINKTSLIAILLASIALLPSNMKAGENDLFLVFNNANQQNPGGTISLNLQNLRTLSFGKTSERILKATYKDSHVDTISTTVIDYLYFADVSTKVNSVAASAGTEMLLCGNCLKVNAEKTSTLRLYTVEGKQILSQGVSQGENVISISSLPHGLYIARTDKSTFKFCK